jgi:acyl-CoA dehydrogenase
MALIVEQLAAGGGGGGLIMLFVTNAIFGGPSLSRFGSEKMKKQILPKIASGEIRCCMALTEPDAGTNSIKEANVAKLLASQAASAAVERSMQTMGGLGYAKEMHVERLWSDARLARIAPISEEMILNFIANQNLGMPRSH